MTQGKRLLILPMAITKADDTYACVGALTPSGEWIRPEPVLLTDVVDRRASPWHYRRWMRVELAPSQADDPRPEDRAIVSPASPDEQWPDPRAHRFADEFADLGVRAALSGDRTLGMTYVSLRRVYAKRSTGGRVFIRFAFTDSTGEDFDWIVPDIDASAPLLAQVVDWQLPADVAKSALYGLQQAGPLLLAIGLTRPNNRFPGEFRGCHPLVVGVHPASGVC